MGYLGFVPFGSRRPNGKLRRKKQMLSNYRFPWHPIEASPGLAEEPRREAPAGHRLFNLPVKAIALRSDWARRRRSSYLARRIGHCVASYRNLRFPRELVRDGHDERR